MRFDRIIEKILIDNAYIGEKIQLPEKSTAEDYYNKHFEFIENSNDEKCYYTDFNKQRIRVIAVKSIRYYIKKYFPWTVKVKWLLFRKYK